MSSARVIRTVLPAGLLLRIASSFGLALMLSLITLKSDTPTGHAAQRGLTFEDRVAALRAIEIVYWRHRIWPADNPQPKPAFDDVMPDAALRAKVTAYLEQSHALEVYWQRPITAVQVQAELERMASQTRQPEVLGELWAALDNDPVVIAECLARPPLVERLLRELGEKEGAGGWKEDIATQPLPLSSVTSVEWGGYRLPEISVNAVPCASSDAWTATTTTGAPSARAQHTAVWTGSEMIVWGGGVRRSSNEVVSTNTGGRYNPTTGSWTATATTGAPSARIYHTAVWTGTEMIVWGGSQGLSGSLNTGGRYNPATDSWTATTTTGAPSARVWHTAVWTGTEIIVWGGLPNFSTNTGGRYNPATDSWQATTTIGAGSERFRHTAVWTGTEMIVWGGTTTAPATNTGGRYNPVTDSWTVTTTMGAPSGRQFPSAFWTGSQMIVWGGSGTSNTGGQYNPATDSWTATTIVEAPSARGWGHTAVWTGSEMIVWGGSPSGLTNTGGRYNPATDLWAATTIVGVPSERTFHSAVWTGSEMIVWGGDPSSAYDDEVNTGARYSKTPHLTISHTTQSFTGAGGTGTVNVNAQGDCTWTATSNTSFITITSGNSGAGDGTVSFSVAANPTISERSGKITITTQTFNVIQAGAQPNPSPTIAGLSPSSAISGSGNLTLTINGSNLVPASVVRWNGIDRVTNFVSGAQVAAQLLASDLANPGTGSVTVFNPLPGGGTSNTLTFPILSTVVTVSAASYLAPVAAESIVAGFGVGLANTTQVAQSVPLPTTLAEVRFQVKDSAGMERDSPLFFVSPGQINFLIPAGTGAGIATTTVFRGNTVVAQGTLQITTVAPGLFTANSDGGGVPASYIIRVKPNGQQLTEDVAVLNQQTGSFVPREIDLTIAGDRIFLILFGTGIRFYDSINNVVMRFGNQDQQVDAALPQGVFVGLDQVNVEMLRSKIPPGPVSATLRVEGIGAKSVDLLVK